MLYCMLCMTVNESMNYILLMQQNRTYGIYRCTLIYSDILKNLNKGFTHKATIPEIKSFTALLRQKKDKKKLNLRRGFF